MTDFEKIKEMDIDEILDQEEYSEINYHVISDNLAEWALKRIKKATDERNRLVALATEQIEELTSKINELDEKYKRETAYFKMKLYEYFNSEETRKNIKETKTQASYKLLSGSLVFKKPTQKMEPNREKLLEYVKANNMPEFVKTKEDIDWAAYKKECEIVDGKVVNTQTGDLLPEDLIEVQDVPGEFDVKL